jgi:hypothetical protein
MVDNTIEARVSLKFPRLISVISRSMEIEVPHKQPTILLINVQIK